MYSSSSGIVNWYARLEKRKIQTENIEYWCGVIDSEFCDE